MFVKAQYYLVGPGYRLKKRHIWGCKLEEKRILGEKYYLVELDYKLEGERRLGLQARGKVHLVKPGQKEMLFNEV